MATDRCICQAEDCAVATDALRKASQVHPLVDTSHFIASIVQCPRCSQCFLKLFCERVDWADGDDPQCRIFVPITEDEANQLHASPITSDENVIMSIVTGKRRILIRDMPKGAPESLEWKISRVYIPAHD